MNKLSEAQRRVLEALAEDRENRWIRADRHGTPSLCGIRESNGLWRKVHSNTLYSLIRLGYVERFKREKAPWWAKDYRITEAGLEAVADRNG